jgi:hypothetical protein
MNLQTASGIGGSNRAITYASDIEYPGDKFREEREDAVWSRARLIVRAFDQFCAEFNVGSWEDADDGRWPAPAWCFTALVEDDHQVHVVMADDKGILAVYFEYCGPSEDGESDGKLQRLPRCLWPQELVNELAENVLGDREPQGRA